MAGTVKGIVEMTCDVGVRQLGHRQSNAALCLERRSFQALSGHLHPPLYSISSRPCGMALTYATPFKGLLADVHDFVPSRNKIKVQDKVFAN